MAWASNSPRLPEWTVIQVLRFFWIDLNSQLGDARHVARLCKTRANYPNKKAPRVYFPLPIPRSMGEPIRSSFKEFLIFSQVRRSEGRSKKSQLSKQLLHSLVHEKTCKRLNYISYIFSFLRFHLDTMFFLTLNYSSHQKLSRKLRNKEVLESII